MNLLKTLSTISSMTMLSRITGLLRELLIARAFGASIYTDAFFVAFRIPNLLRRLFAEGAFSQAFVPILSEYMNRQGKEPTQDLIDKVATALLWALLITTLVGILASTGIVYLIATGFTENQQAFDTAVLMTRMMFPYIICMSLVAMAGGILNTMREFRIPAFTPVLLNLSFIACSLFLAPYMAQPVYALAFAVMIGGVLQLAIQVPALKKIGMLPRFSLRILQAFSDPGVRRVMRQMVPAIFAVSVAQISLLINTNIATHLAPGSVSWLSYADRLMEFPNALFGVALGTILLPSLSKAHSQQNAEEYSSLLGWGIRLTFILVMPAAVLMITMPVPFTTTLFHYGKFNANDVYMTSQALIAYGIGLIGLVMVRILAPGFYAKQDIKTPVKIALGVLIVTQLLNLVFVPFLAHAGLALAIGLGACGNALMLYILLRRRGIYVPQPGWKLFLLKLMGALILLAGVSLWGAAQFDWLSLQATPWMRVAVLSALMAGCGVVYLCALFLMAFRLRDFRRVSL